MKLRYLSVLIIPTLFLSSCNNEIEVQEYRAIDEKNQKVVMEGVYNSHKTYQANLTLYSYKHNEMYDPTYDVFGDSHLYEAKGLYREKTINEEIGVYSGYFIKKHTESAYDGNEKNIGSKKTIQTNTSYWFKNMEGEENIDNRQLIKRSEILENNVSVSLKDVPSEIVVKKDNVSRYFADNINANYTGEFVHTLVQPEAISPKTVIAYYKSENEIVEVTKEITEYGKIRNPIHLENEYKLTIYKTVTASTTFRKINQSAWAGIEYKENTVYDLKSDYELKLISEPRVIRKEETTISFTYSSALQPYSGESFVYQPVDPKIEQNRPYLCSDGSIVAVAEEITGRYKRLYPAFNGYAYQIGEIELNGDKDYSFAKKADIDEGNYETFKVSEITGNILSNIVSSGVENHELFKSLTGDAKYSFIILVSKTGVNKIIANLVYDKK